MTRDEDSVAEAIDRYLSYLEDGGERPTFDDLPADARRELDQIIEGLRTARGIDPYASRPSVEALVAGTEFEDLFRQAAANDPSRALDEVRSLLAVFDDRCRIESAVDEEGHGIVVRRRDLIIYIFVQRGTRPAMTPETRRRATGVFAKPNVARVCVVASAGPEYATQTLSAADLGLRYASPSGARTVALPGVLPVELAVMRLLETCAPEWEPVDFSAGTLDSTPTAEVAAPIVHKLIASEADRAYRGDKARAYRGLVGREHAIIDVISQVASQSEEFDPDAVIAAIIGDAA